MYLNIDQVKPKHAKLARKIGVVGMEFKKVTGLTGWDHRLHFDDGRTGGWMSSNEPGYYKA